MTFKKSQSFVEFPSVWLSNLKFIESSESEFLFKMFNLRHFGICCLGGRVIPYIDMRKAMSVIQSVTSDMRNAHKVLVGQPDHLCDLGVDGWIYRMAEKSPTQLLKRGLK